MLFSSRFFYFFSSKFTFFYSIFIMSSLTKLGLYILLLLYCFLFLFCFYVLHILRSSVQVNFLSDSISILSVWKQQKYLLLCFFIANSTRVFIHPIIFLGLFINSTSNFPSLIFTPFLLNHSNPPMDLELLTEPYITLSLYSSPFTFIFTLQLLIFPI